MKFSRNTIAAAIAGIALAGASLSASATPIEFIFSGTGSGTLDGVAFNDVAFVFTELADTSNAQSCGGACTFIDSTSAQVSLSGIGNYNFVSSTRTFDNSGFVGFSRGGVSGADLFNVFFVGTSYDMASPIGPVSGGASVLQWTNSPVVTTGGTLVFNSSTGLSTFQAVTAVSTVPEPETFAMLLAGLGLVGAVARRRQHKHTAA